MDDSTPTGRANWLWIVIILALIVLFFIWLWKPSGDTGHIVVAPQPTAQATDWAVEPSGPKVPVNLPETEMTNAPAAPAPGN